MGFLDRLLGREARETYPPQGTGSTSSPSPVTAPARYGAGPSAGASTTDPEAQQRAVDERAVARYRYLLRTAPPESLEQVHAEAFAQLGPDQRRQVLAELSRDLPPGEQVPSDDPRSMARFATRAELRRPGFLEQAFGGRGGGGLGRGAGGLGLGGTVMGSMMGTIAGVVVGSMVADALLTDFDSSPEAADVADPAADTGDSANAADDATDGSDGTNGTEAGDVGTETGADTTGDAGAFDSAGYDAGGFGGGDFGGGSDFGGGGFGGGDFGGGSDFGGGF